MGRRRDERINPGPQSPQQFVLIVRNDLYYPGLKVAH
jgi:hypothetical protein